MALTPSQDIFLRHLEIALRQIPWLPTATVDVMFSFQTGEETLRARLWPKNDGVAFNAAPWSYRLRMPSKTLIEAGVEPHISIQLIAQAFGAEVARRTAERQIPFNVLRDPIRFSNSRIAAFEKAYLAKIYPNAISFIGALPMLGYDVCQAIMPVTDDVAEELTCGCLDTSDPIFQRFCIESMRDGYLWGKGDMDYDEAMHMIFCQ